jgi:hypothetical protein
MRAGAALEDEAGIEIATRLQERITKIYEIQSEHSVGEFLVSDPDVARALEGDGPGTRDVQEKLLVRQTGDDVDLALYIDRNVLGRLAAADPTERLTPTNLGDYWVLLEGVSHFVYLTFNAARERPVTLLELELQAEVDKFVTALFQFGAQDRGRVPRRLGALLFDDVDYDEALDADGRERYETANRVARKYCHSLERRFLERRHTARGTVHDLVDDVRRFYRLTQEEKLRAAHEHG